MRKYLSNNKGLTLVEILAALVLLSIILVAFMSFFTQSAKFTAHNNETLSAVQIGEQIVAEVRAGTYLISETIDREGYKIELIIEEGPETLKLATINVISPEGAGINNPEFTTQMYFEETS